MKRLAFLLLGVGLPVLGEPHAKSLPEKVHATRLKSGSFLRLIPIEEKDAEGKTSYRLLPDDAPTAVTGGWYFTDFGYERYLMKTTELQVELDKVKVRVESCATAPVLTLPGGVEGGGFSTQTVVIAGLLGVLVGGGLVLYFTGGSSPPAAQSR